MGATEHKDFYTNFTELLQKAIIRFGQFIKHWSATKLIVVLSNCFFNISLSLVHSNILNLIVKGCVH